MVNPQLSECETFVTSGNNTSFFETSPFKISRLTDEEKTKYDKIESTNLIQPTSLKGKLDTPKVQYLFTKKMLMTLLITLK